MKKTTILIVITAMAFVGCKKQSVDVNTIISTTVLSPSYWRTIHSELEHRCGATAYDSIDFTRYSLSKQAARWYLRLAIKGQPFHNDFLVLQTDSAGHINSGLFLQLQKDSHQKDGTPEKDFNGIIDLRSLDHKTMLHSAVTAGYIEAFHPALFNPTTRIESFPVPYDQLPEIIVTATVSTQGTDGINWSAYINLQLLLNGSGVAGGGGSGTGDPSSGSDAGVYSPVSNNGDNGTGHSSGAVSQDHTFTIDESYFRPAIDLDAWLSCFDYIPDAGATCSVTLYGDLPDEGNAAAGLNIWTGNTGHCFLQLKKSNGAQSVTQIIGFTAQSAGEAVLKPYAYLPSKMVDNAGHKYDCSITMPLSVAGLSTVIKQIYVQAAMPYSIVQYDCLDFALSVVNAVRPSNPLIIKKRIDPNDAFADIATGPKLFALLQQMIASGSPESANISINGPAYAGVSHGGCH